MKKKTNKNLLGSPGGGQKRVLYKGKLGKKTNRGGETLGKKITLEDEVELLIHRVNKLWDEVYMAESIEYPSGKKILHLKGRIDILESKDQSPGEFPGVCGVLNCKGCKEPPKDRLGSFTCNCSGDCKNSLPANPKKEVCECKLEHIGGKNHACIEYSCCKPKESCQCPVTTHLLHCPKVIMGTEEPKEKGGWSTEILKILEKDFPPMTPKWRMICEIVEKTIKEERRRIANEIKGFKLLSFKVDGQTGQMEKEILHQVNIKVDEILEHLEK